DADRLHLTVAGAFAGPMSAAFVFSVPSSPATPTLCPYTTLFRSSTSFRFPSNYRLYLYSFPYRRESDQACYKRYSDSLPLKYGLQADPSYTHRESSFPVWNG